MIVRAFLLMLPLAVAAAPTFELTGPWFDVDFARGATNGVTVCDTAEGRTLAPTQQLAASTPAGIRARVRYADEDIPGVRRLPDLSARGVQAALTVAQRMDGAFAFYGWTADGWIELEGAVPQVDTDIDIRADVDASRAPATVRYSADGVPLVACGSGGGALAVAEARGVAAVDLVGAGDVSEVSGERELVERVAAVVRGDEVAYCPDLASARRTAKNGGAVTLLRPTTVAAVDDLYGRLALHETALAGGVSALTWAGDVAALSGEKALIELPAGFTGDGALWSPASPEALAALHVHGAAGVPCTVYPHADGGLHVREERLPLDDGGYVAYFTVPEGARTFLRGLSDSQCGTENTLYVNGLGELVLCQTNAFTGRLVIEGDPQLVKYATDDFSRALRIFIR